MRFKKLEKTEALGRTNGTSLKGYLATGIKFKDLYQAFGEPTFRPEDSGDGKVQYEWTFEYKGNVYTVYDWKTYDEEYTLTEYDNWHVGAKTFPGEFIELVEKLTSKTVCQN
jgi:hypothetical protein